MIPTWSASVAIPNAKATKATAMPKSPHKIEARATASVGTDVAPDVIDWNTAVASFYSDGGAGGTPPKALMIASPMLAIVRSGSLSRIQR